MNIKNKLKKLEQGIAPNVDDFCQCFDKNIQANIGKVYGESFISSDILPESAVPSNRCPQCRKPIEERVRQVYRNVEEIYGGAQ